MNRSERELPVVYLKPGEMHFTADPTLIVTVLGSCLSVTMFNRRSGLGGISHGLLPLCPDRKTCKKRCREIFKFVDCSIQHMVKLFERRGVKRNEIEVKCFGAADMFSQTIDTVDVDAVGSLNVHAAEATILSEGLRILKMDVGGLQGRKIHFNTETGEVFLKRLSNINKPDRH
jgi:chemotaxis protein CheD